MHDLPWHILPPHSFWLSATVQLCCFAFYLLFPLFLYSVISKLKTQQNSHFPGYLLFKLWLKWGFENEVGTGVPWVCSLLALCHALSVSPIDNHPALASVNLIDLATHRDKETVKFLQLDKASKDFNTEFPRKGTYLHFEVAHVCMGSRSKEGRGVGCLVREGVACAPPPLLSLQAAHHN